MTKAFDSEAFRRFTNACGDAHAAATRVLETYDDWLGDWECDSTGFFADMTSVAEDERCSIDELLEAASRIDCCDFQDSLARTIEMELTGAGKS